MQLSSYTGDESCKKILNDYASGNICVWFDSGIDECHCAVWFSSGIVWFAAGVVNPK